MIDHTRLIAALRDTAAKATETKEVTRPDNTVNHAWRQNTPSTYTETVEAYSKEWIAGRLLGMADTIEALVSANPNTIGD